MERERESIPKIKVWEEETRVKFEQGKDNKRECEDGRRVQEQVRLPNEREGLVPQERDVEVIDVRRPIERIREERREERPCEQQGGNDVLDDVRHDEHGEEPVAVDVEAVEPLDAARGRGRGGGRPLAVAVAPLLAADVLEGVHGERGVGDGVRGEDVGGDEPAGRGDYKADEEVVDKDGPRDELQNAPEALAETDPPGEARDAHQYDLDGDKAGVVSGPMTSCFYI